MTLDANTERIITEAERLGIADEIKIRDLRIRFAFKEMRTSGTNYEDALSKCADIFYLSVERIKTITKGITLNESGKKGIDKAA